MFNYGMIGIQEHIVSKSIVNMKPFHECSVFLSEMQFNYTAMLKIFFY